jgi:CheY-like chemotaxis protein
MKTETISRAKRMNPRDTDGLEPPVLAHRPGILVADDDEGIRYLISTVLTSAGFDVNAASDGQQAWEALLHDHYDLLVTDNEMPRLRGIELIERIREAGMILPVIVVSGTLPLEQVRGLPLGQIAAVLPKPFDIGKLLDSVRHALQAWCGDTTSDQGASRRLDASPTLIR